MFHLVEPLGLVRDCIIVGQVLLAPGLGGGWPHLLGLVVGEAAAIPRDGISLPEVDVVDGAGTDNCPCLT